MKRMARHYDGMDSQVGTPVLTSQADGTGSGIVKFAGRKSIITGSGGVAEKNITSHAA